MKRLFVDSDECPGTECVFWDGDECPGTECVFWDSDECPGTACVFWDSDECPGTACVFWDRVWAPRAVGAYNELDELCAKFLRVADYETRTRGSHALACNCRCVYGREPLRVCRVRGRGRGHR